MFMGADKKTRQPRKEENKVIFAPMDEIIKIEQAIDNMEIVQKELLKVAEGMKAL